MTVAASQARTGILYLVAVPIGHFDDITLRACQILRDADLIASENPAATRLLLSHHGIDATLTSYGPANIREKAALLIDRLQRGAHIALVSDCGSPVVADPGSLLVASAHAHGIRVVSVPGPSALTASVVAAGLASDTFVFLGQLPETQLEMNRRLSNHLAGKVSAVAFCTANSLVLALNRVADIAPRRRIMLACDLTKPSERIVQGTALQIRQALDKVQGAQDITFILTGGAARETNTLRTKGTQ
jgi:16S rRNA (cytidine1402-2'-O)-methyltransferase